MLVAEVLTQRGVDPLRRQLAVRRGEGEYLVSGRLDSRRLMHQDMPVRRRHRRLKGAEEGRNGGQIGLRAAREEMHVAVLKLYLAADEPRRLKTVFVLAVAGVMSIARAHKLGYDIGVGGLAVIVLEAVHAHFTAFMSANTVGSRISSCSSRVASSRLRASSASTIA